MNTSIEVLSGNKFETHNFLIKIIRAFFVPLINNVRSAHALEVMYSRHQRRLFSRGIVQGIADFFWHHVISQLKAIRNRLKIVEDNIEKELADSINSGKEEIQILTVGGGSCRAIIHTVSRLKDKYPKTKIKVTNIDKDPKAIELGAKIAEAFDVGSSFNWINDDAPNINL